MTNQADAYSWVNPFGGLWGSVSNWIDTTTNTVANSVPGASNSVSITGGTNENFTNIVGAGAALQLSINDDVVLWGSVAVGSTVTLGPSAEIDLDGEASLLAGSLNLMNSASLEVGGVSTLKVTGGATLEAGFLAAMDGSVVQFGALIANGINNGFALETGTIAVDDDSSVEVGTTGGAALGAITIDRGLSAAISGTIDGNLVVNGVLGIQAYGNLSVDVADPFGSAQTAGGSGTLALSENSLLTLGVADSAAIKFGGPGGTLDLDVIPTGTISGFAAGDVIEIGGRGTALATGLSATQTSSVTTLTLTKGGKSVGTLTLAGNYTSSLFHLGLDASGDGLITLQTIGSAPAQPALIVGTAGYDTLNATANNQALAGLGGNDVLNAATFTGIDFKDTSADLSGSTITAFGASDLVDVTDLKLSSASVSFTPGGGDSGTLIVTDGAHAATIGLSFGSVLPAGNFTTGTDGAAGTDVRFTTVNNDTYLFGSSPGGSFATASKWQDTTTGTTATVAPSSGNAVTIAGGAGGNTNITGIGFAASLTTSGGVVLWGSLAVGGKLAGVSGALAQTGTLALDGGADLVLAGTAAVGGLIEIGGGSTLTAAGGMDFSSNGASLLAIDGGSAQFATLLGAGGLSGEFDASAIGVDATSSIEFGTAGNATQGALTIDSGVTADLAGSIDGNVVVNGTLAVAGTLAIGPFGSTAPSVTGTGVLALTLGDTLSLAGRDNVAILFSQTASGAFSSNTETLALAASLPTGTISGFSQGDVITLGKIVTGLAYIQTGGSGKLTLLNGSTTVGTLLLSGTYVASQFQVQLLADGVSSSIKYLATPSTVVGNQTSVNNDSYAWSNASGGVWSNAGNWTDTTSGGTSTAAPGAGNAVTISNDTGASTAQIISGNGSAASLTVGAAANTILTGTISVGGAFSVTSFGAGSGDVALANGATLTAGSLNVSSPLQVAGGSALSIFGSSNGTFISGRMTEFGGSSVKVTGGSSLLTGMIAVDGTSSFEFGAAGGAAAGTLTIDNGQTPTLQGVATIAANLVLGGNMLIYEGTIEGLDGSTGSISGAGTITIGALGAAGLLTLNASDSASIVFQPNSVNGVPFAFETLQLDGPLPTGTISGFIAGDAIIVDRTVTGVASTQTTGNQGILTLTNGAATVGTLTLGGNYTTSLFQVDVAATTGVATISVEVAPSAGGIAAASTGNHAYSWSGVSGGSWTTAADWTDTTTATTPITVPGSLDAVTIAGGTSAGQYTTIGGNGAAASLTINGNVLLTGQVAVAGQVLIAPGSGPAATLALERGAKLTAGGSVSITGRLEVGGGSSAAITGTAALMGGSLLALGGSTVQAGGLIGDGSGDVIAVDANSIVKIGAPVTASAGALTQAPSAVAAFSGSIYGSVVANGTFSVTGGGALFIDMNGTEKSDPYASTPTISGTGTLSLTDGSTLGLGVADSTAIQFAGPNATLVLGAVPTGTITGFAAGDQIQLDQTITGLVYRQLTTTSAILTLNDGVDYVGTLKLAGSFGGGLTAFHLDSAANGSMAVITLQSLLIAPTQPTLIQGTVGADLLTATANGQTMTGAGGGDTLSGGAFTGIDFKDLTANLSGSTIQDFAVSDVLDFTDLKASSAAETYAGGVLSVTDGTNSATLGLGFASTPSTGAFHIAGDGATGTKLTWS